MRKNELSAMTPKYVLPYHMQFFADAGAGDGAGAEDDDEDDEDDDEGDGDGDGKNDKTGDQAKGKTGNEKKEFTQAELNKMMKAEKDSGKRAMLKSFGFKDEKEAKAAMDALKKFQDSQKTETEKQTEKVNTLTSEKTAAEKRAEYLENKFTALGEGVKLDVVDDIVTMAMSKVTDDKDLKAVLADMKKNATYAAFFTEAGDGSNGSNGTGTGVNGGKKTGGKVTGMGARLAAAGKPATTAKSSYFSN
jgi:hypothetical protein